MAELLTDTKEVRESIRELLFTECGEEVQEDLLAWEELDPYLEELCSFGVERLSREPDVLAGEYSRIQKQLQDVACSNYRALIDSFESSGSVRDGVSDVKIHLKSLSETAPKLSDAVRHFSRDASEAESRRQTKLKILNEYPRILETLEIPQLMLSLVRLELHDEALELMAYTRKLSRNYPDVQEIQKVASEVDEITTIMVNQLLMLLRSSIQLPMCLRVVSYLRRVQHFNEADIRRVFLQYRGKWMRSALQSTAAPSAQGLLERISDDTRSMIFEIATQYRAVFLDEHDSQHDTGLSILHDWIVQGVENYVSTVETALKDIKDGAGLATVLQQSMYCGQSLGRVGADFRPLLAPLFENAVERIYASSLEVALHRFRAMTSDYNWPNKGNSTQVKETRRRVEANVDQHSPPVEILEHSPLAVFTNGLLAAHNELRFCCPLSLERRLSKILENTLLGCVQVMRDLGGENGLFLSEEESVSFADMVKIYKDYAAPYAVRCLEKCLGQKSSADLDLVVKDAESLLPN
uniref:Conserved oligomeric Golgi complex subunit 8 n=1 Tax=Rhodosorus marinus TaxID=101924 RepID=A0A7S3A3W6_9RHOD|mmetsp:Transcript_41645/g.163546  ORF Transcript_41645/g.163546 Transcript_41645/m.163546 type:complete len:524 (+) Transcript_41645:220-1791(+)